jgi:NADH-quinone oxidoreductase subunit N
MSEYAALIPLLVVVGGAILVLLLEAFWPRKDKTHLAVLALLTVAGSGAACVRLWGQGASAFGGMLRLDDAALVFTAIFLAAVAFTILIALKFLPRQNADFGEFYGLLLLALSGLMVMVSSPNLIVVVLGLEILSVSSYALAGLKRDDDRASEAAIKYFLMGSFASAFLIFGLALLYGSSQSLEIPAVAASFAGPSGDSLLGLAGLILVLIGFAFKIALVPFHMWTPDVYQGAPTPVTAFFAVGPKAAGFAVLFKLIAPVGDQAFRSAKIHAVLGVLAALTMLVASLTALRQRNVKRLLAYSSIANAGYLLIAVLAGDGVGLMFFLAVYLFMSFGAFGALIAMSRRGEEFHDLDDFAGIGFKYPWIGALFSIFLISLAGFPPFGGFLAKYYIFSAAVHKGLLPLVLIGLLASLISAYYYLRIVVLMYMREPVRDVEIDLDAPALYLVLFLCLYGVLQLGLFPGNILIVLKRALASLFL